MSPSNPAQTLTIDPAPLYALSPYLYMQFMEPLGATDGSVEAAWDHQSASWRPDVVEATRGLAPSLIRWGGCLSSYYRWEEGVGPRAQRKPMHNLLWGGIESNQVGTGEFVDFCRQVGAEGFFCVNFESDGRKPWANPRVGGPRAGEPEEAARWVRYCNDPHDALRRSHGARQPYNLSLWQIGNETSYDPNGYDLEMAAERTVAFALAMREADPTIQLIGWGDSGWARGMIERAGEHLDYIAFHHMFHPCPGDPILDGTNYRRDPEHAWEALMNAHTAHAQKVEAMRDGVEGSGLPLALTECHFDIPGRDRGDVLSSWAAGVAYARMLNLHERHGDVLKIATLSDFCGTRWQVNSVMIPTPGGRAYLLPVAHVMRLYRSHSGERAVTVRDCPGELDVTASRTGERIFLHVVNTRRTQAVTVRLTVAGFAVRAGRCFEIAADPAVEVLQSCPEVLQTQEKPWHENDWTFPAASVSAIELELR